MVFGKTKSKDPVKLAKHILWWVPICRRSSWNLDVSLVMFGFRDDCWNTAPFCTVFFIAVGWGFYASTSGNWWWMACSGRWDLPGVRLADLGTFFSAQTHYEIIHSDMGMGQNHSKPITMFGGMDKNYWLFRCSLEYQGFDRIHVHILWRGLRCFGKQQSCVGRSASVGFILALPTWQRNNRIFSMWTLSSKTTSSEFSLFPQHLEWSRQTSQRCSLQCN